MHMLLKIPYYFILPYSGGFRVLVNQSGFEDPPDLVSGLDYHSNRCSRGLWVLSSGFGFRSAKASPDQNPPHCYP
jgi:hypothetical protein